MDNLWVWVDRHFWVVFGVVVVALGAIYIYGNW
jgi:hypothetical protein